MLIKRIPLNIVLLCLKDVTGFLFIEFQEGNCMKITVFGCFSGFSLGNFVINVDQEDSFKHCIVVFGGCYRFLFIEFQEGKLYKITVFEYFSGFSLGNFVRNIDQEDSFKHCIVMFGGCYRVSFYRIPRGGPYRILVSAKEGFKGNLGFLYWVSFTGFPLFRKLI